MKKLLLVAALTLCGCEDASQTGPIVGEVIFGVDSSKPMPAENSRLNYPEDAVEAKDGSIYISDTHLHVIKRMKDGVIENFAGTFNAGYNGDGDRASAMLNTPTGLLISNDQKYLLFADSGNAIIRRIELNTGKIETIAGIPGNPKELPTTGKPALGFAAGYASVLKYDPQGRMCYQTSKMSLENTSIGGGIFCIKNDGTTEAVKTNTKFGLDGIRDFLITDSHTYILRSTELHKISKSGEIKSLDIPIQHGKGLIADKEDIILGVHTEINRVSKNLKKTTIANGFANVSNIKKYSKGMLVVDSDQGVVYSFDGINKTQLTGTSTNSVGALTSVAQYGEGKLLILDNQRPRIFIYDIKSGKSSVWAGTGAQGWATINVDKLDTKFYYPTAIAVDNDLNVFISEQHRIMKIDNKGQVSLFAGNDRDGDVDSEKPENARFRSISGLSFGRDGSLYVSDTYNNKIRKISVSGKVGTIAGTGVAGSPVFGKPAISVPLNHPLGVIPMENGEVLIADSWNNSVVRVDQQGILHAFAGKPIQAGYQGMGDYSGDNQPAINAGLNTPAKIAVDSHGNVFISDQFNHRVRMVSKDGNIITIAGEAQGFAPNGKRLNFPNGLQIIDGQLYVADSGNRLIARYRIEK